MFNRQGKKFLRKKSDLIHDYFLAGSFIISLGILMNKYNKKINPPDASEELPSYFLYF